jgi:hypothetical protein
VSASVFFAYALILQSTAILYLPRTQAESLSADVREHLVREGIKVEAYEDVWARLKEVRMGLLGDGKGKLVVGMRTSLAVADAVGFVSFLYHGLEPRAHDVEHLFYFFRKISICSVLPSQTPSRLKMTR